MPGLIQGSCLAEGGFGKVYEGVYDEKTQVVIKRGRQVAEEKAILQSLIGATGVIQMITDTGVEEGALVLERMDTDLGSVMKEKRLKECEVQWIAKEVTTALSELEERGICHGDIKPSNLLLQYNCSPRRTLVRIADFGSAQIGGKIPNTISQGYRAPEAIIGVKENENCWEVDMWCLGVTLYEGVSGSNPFDCGAITALWKMCEIGRPPFPRTLCGIDAEYSETFHNLSLQRVDADALILDSPLITQLLSLTAAERPSPSSLLTSPLLQDVKPVTILQDMTPPRQRGSLPIQVSPPPVLPDYGRRM
eukprot:TRINITY_DN12234_c2_g1_i1.p1 TRINITY_DN12234_c2_g1~~TRINITY_DN12234_c2_g1_i1.p1  ORF type:complete len:307 (+),score=44.69 TRINITY_DN12234_c2_g1_i1:92-1012(+)